MQYELDPISIIIPTYNRVKTLTHVIGSYMVQKKVREILIVDDGSTDGTREFVLDLKKNNPKLTYLRNNKNVGPPATRNIGVKYSSGEIILFGEDDLHFAPDYAERLLLCMERNRCSIIAGRILFPFPGESEAEVMARISVSGRQRLNRCLIMYDASSPASDDIQVPFIHACSMVRREVFNEVQYDEKYRGNAYREETDFYLRAGRAGHKVFFCPHTICFHLPREVKILGGNWSRGIWVTRYWSVRNNYRFLKNNYDYLKRENLVAHNFATLMFLFTVSEMQRIFTFYMRKWSPDLYVTLARKFSKIR